MAKEAPPPADPDPLDTPLPLTPAPETWFFALEPVGRANTGRHSPHPGGSTLPTRRCPCCRRDVRDGRLEGRWCLVCQLRAHPRLAIAARIDRDPPLPQDPPEEVIQAEVAKIRKRRRK